MGVQKLEKWGTVRCRLEIEEARLTAFDNENKEFSEKNLQNVTTFEREGRLSCNIHIRHNSCLYPPPPPPEPKPHFINYTEPNRSNEGLTLEISALETRSYYNI